MPPSDSSTSGDRRRSPAPPVLDAVAAVAWRFLVVAGVIWVIAWFVARISVAVLPVVLAGILAAIFIPPARWLQQRGWRPGLAAFTVLITALLVIAGVFTLIVPRFAAQLGSLRTQLSQAAEQLGEQFGLETQALQLSALQDRLINLAQEHVSQILQGAGLLLEVLTGLLLTIVLLFFFVKDRRQIFGWIMRQVPTRRRDTVRAVLMRGWDTLGGYFRGLVVIATIDAIGVGIGLALIGTPLVVSLMVLTFVGALFPVVGTFTAGVVVVLVAFVGGGVTDALLALAVIIVVQQLEGHVLHPVIMRRAVHLHPAVILFALTAGAVLAGVTGAFLGVPAFAVATAMGAELRDRQQPAV